MSVVEIDRSRRLLAAAEAARLTEFLAAAKAVEDARAAPDAFEAHCVMAEDRLLRLAADPGLATFLLLILEQLSAIAEGPACA